MAAVIGTPCMSFHDCFRRAPKVRRPIKAACLSASIGVQMSLSTRCWPPQVTRPLLTTFRDRSSCPVTGHTVKYTQQHHHSFPSPDKAGVTHFATAVCEAHLYILMHSGATPLLRGFSRKNIFCKKIFDNFFSFQATEMVLTSKWGKIQQEIQI